MTTSAQSEYYRDDAVFQPSEGTVLYAEPGAEPPTLDEVRTWISTDRMGQVGTTWTPAGYTSIDDLPGIGSDTEGGEKKGVWENPSFRLTPITSTDTVTVKPVQWTDMPIQWRFGKGTIHDESKGIISVPKTYVSTEQALIVVILDGDNPLILHFPRASSAPDDDLELDPDSFIALPVKFTILNQAGTASKMNILAYHLQTTQEE